MDDPNHYRRLYAAARDRAWQEFRIQAPEFDRIVRGRLRGVRPLIDSKAWAEIAGDVVSEFQARPAPPPKGEHPLEDYQPEGDHAEITPAELAIEF